MKSAYGHVSQAKELPGSRRLRGQEQANKVRGQVARLDWDRGGGPDAGAQQQGRQQVHRWPLAG